MKHRAAMANFLAADIYGITDETHSLGRGNVETVRLMLAAGITVIQYRQKDKLARQMYEECQAIRKLTRQAGATFIVNDYIDLALAVKADGVHVGQDDLPPEKVRELIGDTMLLGLSTHSPEQARAAVTLGVVDYIGVGPLYATRTKKDVCQPVGLEYLSYVVRNIELPFVAIGGIKEHNLADVRQAGARTICLVTEIVGASDLPAKVQDLRALLAENTAALVP
ncbi:MAG: thiamine phosphate synthase [Negativicutes bacterium]|nr:thiamine phosphate synthase [Negativicutes bacterium]